MRTFATAMTAMVLLSIFAAISPLEDTLTQQLPVITITAPKELVPLDKVASAVSAISFETLQKSSTFRPNALSSIIPGLHIPDYGASLTSTIYLRGLGSRMENPVMGLYIDGIPVIDKNAYDFDWEGVSRATMLHGPQGTLYGRNAMGGVLSLSTFSPCDDYRPTLRIEYGTANTVRAGISFTAGSNALSATFRHTDGYFNNAYKNEPCDPYSGLSLRWKRVSNCDGNLTMTNTLSANISQEGGFAYGMWKDGKQQPVSYNDEGSYKRLSVIEGFRLRHHGNLLVTDATASLQLLADDMHMDQDYTDRSIFTLQQKELSGAGTMEITIHRADEETVWQPQTGLFAFGRRNQLSAPVTFKREGIETLILNNANSHIPTDIGQLAYVNRQQSVQKFQTVKAGLFLLTQKQIGHGADEDRFCPDTKLQCLLEFGGSLIEREFKALVAGKLRNDIMVVGIEPFGHLHCRHIYSVLLITVSHCEIEFQTVILKRVITLRDGSQSQAQVKSLVIKREIVGGNEVDSGLLLQQPVLLTYQSCRIQQFLL